MFRIVAPGLNIEMMGWETTAGRIQGSQGPQKGRGGVARRV